MMRALFIQVGLIALILMSLATHAMAQGKVTACNVPGGFNTRAAGGFVRGAQILPDSVPGVETGGACAFAEDRDTLPRSANLAVFANEAFSDPPYLLEVFAVDATGRRRLSEFAQCVSSNCQSGACPPGAFCNWSFSRPEFAGTANTVNRIVTNITLSGGDFSAPEAVGTLVVSQTNGSSFSSQPFAFDFAAQDTAKQKTFILQNPSGQADQIEFSGQQIPEFITLTGQDASAFRIVTSSDQFRRVTTLLSPTNGRERLQERNFRGLAIGEQQPLVVEFTPEANRQYNAILTIKSDAGNHPEFQIALSGTGTGFLPSNPATLALSVLEPTGAAGESRTLRFDIAAPENSQDLTNIEIDHDVAFFAPGFTVDAAQLPSEPCGIGSGLSLTSPSFLNLRGGALNSGQSCTFDVVVNVPKATAPDSYRQQTGPIRSTAGGQALTSAAAVTQIEITRGPLPPSLSVAFDVPDVRASETAPLTYELSLPANALAVTDIAFDHDVNFLDNQFAFDPSTVPNAPCGPGSSLSFPSPSFVQLRRGALAPGESCRFTLTVETDATAPQGARQTQTGPIRAQSGSTNVPVQDPNPSFASITILAPPPELLADCDAPAAPGVNWSGCDKSLEDLSAADLRGGIFIGTVFQGADLEGTNFGAANLTDADLSNTADFTRTNLRRAIFTGATLLRADLTLVDAPDTNFRGADLTQATLVRADGDFVDFSNANLTGANVTGGNTAFRNGIFERANITSTDFSQAFLPDTNFSEAFATVPPQFRAARLTSADFSFANIPGVNFNFASVERAIFSGVDLETADLTELQFTPQQTNPIFLPQDQTLRPDPGQTTATARYITQAADPNNVLVDYDATAILGSGGDLSQYTTVSPPLGSALPLGDTLVTLVITDRRAIEFSTLTHTFTVTVEFPANPATMTINAVEATGAAGQARTLRFEITAPDDSADLTNIEFEHDVAFFATGFTVDAAELPNEPCGTGSGLSLTSPSFLNLRGGALKSGQNCAFDVVINVPEETPVDSYRQQTGPLRSTANGEALTSDAAVTQIEVTQGQVPPTLTLALTPQPAPANSKVRLTYTFAAPETALDLTEIELEHDIDFIIQGFDFDTAGAPSTPCGAGSSLSFNAPNFVNLRGGSLASGETCSFSLDIVIPGTIALGDYQVLTSAVRAKSGPSAADLTSPAASTTLTVSAPLPLEPLEANAVMIRDPLPAGFETDYIVTLTNPNVLTAATDLAGGLAINAGAHVPGLNLDFGNVTGSGCAGTLTAQTIAPDPEVVGATLSDGFISAASTCQITARVRTDANTPPGTYPIIGTADATFDGIDVSATFTDLPPITIASNNAPVITVPADIAADAAVGTAATAVTFSVSVSDAEDGAITPTITSAPTAGLTSGSDFPVGVTTLTVSATDSDGNAAEESFTVTVNDVEAPVLTVPDNIAVNTDTGEATAVVTFDITASDGVDGDIIPVIASTPTTDLISGSAFPIGETTLSVSATDTAGNAAQQIFTVTVTDGEAPTITGVPTQQERATTSGETTVSIDVTTLGVTVTDNVDVSLPPVFTINDSVVTGAFDFTVGETTVVIDATDSAGNAATQQAFIVRVSTMPIPDTTPPVLSLPSNIDVESDAGRASANVSFTVSASDDVDGAITPTIISSPSLGLSSGSDFPIGVTTITISAVDTAGNRSESQFSVTVSDAEAPTITGVPIRQERAIPTGETTVSLDVTTLGVLVTDNVDMGLAPVFTIGSAVVAGVFDFPVGDTTVLIDASDSAGNKAVQQSFVVRITATPVDDTIAPIVIVPADIAINTDVDQATAVVNFSVSASDDVDGAIMPTITSAPTPGLISGSAFPVGVTTLTVSASDAAGNGTQETFTVTVSDGESPSILNVPTQQDRVTESGMTTFSLDISAFGILVNDNVDTALDPVFTIDNAVITGAFDFSIGETTVLIDATDSAGNTAIQQSFIVRVTSTPSPDTTPPVLSLPNNISVSADPVTRSAIVSFSISASDNIDGQVTPKISSTPIPGLTSGSAFPLGVTTLTVEARDSAGNESLETFTVTVLDQNVPMFTTVRIASDNSNKAQAKAGNQIALSLIASEDLNAAPSVLLGGQNASVSGSGSVYEATITVGTLIPDGPISLEVDTYQDLSGNSGLRLTDTTDGSSVNVDQTAPVINITTSTTGPVRTAFPVTFTVSEEVTGFTLADIDVQNATVSDFVATSSLTFSALITPIDDGDVSVGLSSNDVQDAAGNANSESTNLVIASDLTSPTVSIVSSLSDSASGDFDLTITFSEDVIGFGLDSLTIGNGSASNLIATSGSTYTATITPTSDGIVTVDVLAGIVQDNAGNDNTAAPQFSIESDGSAPTVVLSSNAPDAVNGPFAVTLTFSEDVTGLTQNDLVATNATISDFRGTGAVYTLTMTPTKSGQVSLGLAAGVAQDDAGNLSEAAETLSREADLDQPTVNLTSNSPALISGLVEVSVTFSEDVTGFGLDGLSLDNATAQNLTGSGQTYQFELIPSQDGDVSVFVSAGAAMDSVGNKSLASDPLSFVFDGTPPTLILSSPAPAIVNGPFSITVSASEEVSGLEISDFIVTNGTLSALAGTGQTFELTLTPDMSGEITLTIKDGAVSDDAGNLSPASDVFLRAIDIDPPSVILSSDASEFINAPFSVEITFSEPVSEFARDDINVTNATLSEFSDRDTAYFVRVTPETDGKITLIIPEAVTSDLNGNSNTPSESFIRVADLTAPTVTLETDIAVLTTSAFDTSVTFSEAVTGFQPDDVATSNVNVIGISGGPVVYKLSLESEADGPITLSVNEAVATDIAGNPNRASTELTLQRDTTGPILSITSENNDVSGPFTVNFDIDETVTDFTQDDIIVSNGTLTNFSGNGDQYSALITPETLGVVTIRTTDGATTDMFGNGSAATELTINVAVEVPMVSLQVNANPSNPAAISSTVSLTNPGSQPLAFITSIDQAWLDVTPSRGEIGSLGTFEFSISLNDDVRPLEPGVYSATITIELDDQAGTAKPSFVSLDQSAMSTSPALIAQIPVSLTVNEPLGTLDFVVRTPSGPTRSAPLSFSSDIQEINGLVRAADSGESRITILDLEPGVFQISQTTPEGYQLSSIACSGDVDNGSTINLASGQLNLDVDFGESLVCTFETTRAADTIRIATQRAIRNFMARRGDRLIQSAPDLSNRFSARGNIGGGTASANAVAGRTSMDIRASLAGFRNKAVSEAVGDNIDLMRPVLDGWDIWAAAEYSKINDQRDGSDAESEFFAAQLGVDYQLQEDLIVGGLIQYDWMSETDDDIAEGVGAISGAQVSGNGFMVGPYVVWRPQETLTLDAMGLWGRSDNTINPLGFYEDDFETDRLLLQANVTGEVTHKGWRLRPQLGWSHYEDHQKAYIDQLGIDIPSQTVSIGRLSVGPDLIWSTEPVSDGYSLELGGSFRMVWDYNRAGQLDPTGQIRGGSSPARADGDLTFGIAHTNGLRLRAQLGLDGIGSGNFSAQTGRLELAFPFGLKSGSGPRGTLSNLSGAFGNNTASNCHGRDTHPSAPITGRACLDHNDVSLNESDRELSG